MNKSPLPISPLSWNIPTRLDVGNGTEREMRESGTEHICGTCAVNSRHQPIHCVQISSSPAPPSYHSVVSTPSRDRLTVPNPSRDRLAVPTLTLQTSCGPSVPLAAHSAFRYSTERRPRVRFRQDAPLPPSPCTTIDEFDNGLKVRASGSSIPNTPVDEDADCIRRRSKPGLGLGLGIPVAPFKPDASPIRSPGSETLARAEKGEFEKRPSPNIAQRIEEKLLEYSHSGNVAKRWLLEIISWTISAVCITAISVVLFSYSDKPVPDKWPMGITMNAFIATFSRIASAALLLPVSEAIGQLKWLWFQGNSKKMWDFEIFDNASRGPWGSFLLLVRTKGTTLAALGAAITIFVMALDPFFQQVVHYPQSFQLQTNHSRIPRIIRYEQDMPEEFKFQFNANTSEDILISENNPNADVRFIADKYFYDIGIPEVEVGNVTRPEIPISCPFDSCSWETYETLGVCSKCADVSEKLEFRCREAPLDWVINATSWDPYVNGTSCGWWLNASDAKPILMTGYRNDPASNEPQEILTTRLLPLTTNINRKLLFGGSIKFGDIRNRLTDFIVVSPSEGPDNETILKDILQHKQPRAQECMLSMCIKKINSSYYMGNYTEVIIEPPVMNLSTGPDPWTSLPLITPEVPDGKQFFYTQNISIYPAQAGGPGNVTEYGVWNDTAYNIIRVFDDYLPSFVIRQNRTPQSLTYLKYRTAFFKPTFREYDQNHWSAPRNVTIHMENLAERLTNMMRSSSSSESFNGTSHKLQTIVEVRWPWLSLPAGLLLLTLVFLVATILRTSFEQDRVGVWKNSAIANLIYGLPDKQRKKLLTSQVHGTPRTRAKMLHVRMLPTKDWRISGNLFSPSPSRLKPATPPSQAPPGWL